MSHSAAPKYFRLYEFLRDQIRRGEFRPNQQLPTEFALCERFRLSRGTVRKAFDALAAERLVKRRQGLGIFVNPHRASLGAFSLGEGPSQPDEAVEVRTLAFDTVPATEAIATELAVPAAAPLFHIAQLQTTGHQRPLIYEERWLPVSLCPGLDRQQVEDTPAHWLLVHQYKLPLVRVKHDIEATQASKRIAQLLALKPGDPVFAIHRLTFTGSPVRPAVLYRAWCRADHYQFHAEFQSFL